MIPPGMASPPYAPLMATTGIWGNRRRTTERNSKPDICGMFRSESTTAGNLLFNCKSASKPCTALLTSYPPALRTIPTLSRTASSSSTTRISCLEAFDMGTQTFSPLQEKQIFQETNDRIQRLVELSKTAHILSEGATGGNLNNA